MIEIDYDSKGYKSFNDEVKNSWSKCVSRLKNKGSPIPDVDNNKTYHIVTAYDSYDPRERQKYVEYLEMRFRTHGIKPEYGVCEVCNQKGLRYVFVMAHPELDRTYCVGQVCAAIMSGEIDRAYQLIYYRERLRGKYDSIFNRLFNPKKYERTNVGTYFLKTQIKKLKYVFFVNSANNLYYIKVIHDSDVIYKTNLYPKKGSWRNLILETTNFLWSHIYSDEIEQLNMMNEVNNGH